MAVINDRIAPTVRQTWIDPIRETRSVSTAILKVFEAIIRGIQRLGPYMGARSCTADGFEWEKMTWFPQFRADVTMYLIHAESESNRQHRVW